MYIIFIFWLIYIIYSSIAQSVEHAAVNRRVVGSSPTWGAKFCTISSFGRATDSESVGPGFEPPMVHQNTMPMKHGILIYNSEKTKSLSDSYEI